MRLLRFLLILVLASSVACSSCGDVDKKGDPFKTTEDDMGGDTDPVDDMTTDPADMPGPGDTSPNEQPTLEVTPQSLQFLDVPVGASAEQTLTVTNAGVGTLEISSITLVEVTTDDPGGQELATGGQWTSAASLESGDSITLSVVHAPGDSDADAGYVEIRANDPTLDDGTHRVSITTGAAEPNISVTSAVVFGRVAPVTPTTEDQVWELLEVRNTGTAPLQIADIIVTPAGSNFSVSYPQSPTSEPNTDSADFASSIAPGESMLVRVFFNPIDDLPDSAELIFFTNDPDSAETAVELIGNSGLPCIQLSEESELDFGSGAVGFTTNRTLIIENCSSTAPLQISDFSVCTDDAATGTCSANGVFGVNVGTLGTSGSIRAGETATLTVSFSPVELVVSTGMLTIESNDTAKSTLEVPLRGEGTDGNACPVAVAEGRVSGTNTYSTNINTIPLKTIELRGTNSTDPDGSVMRYEWTIVQRPQGSSSTFTPSSDVAAPQIFLDLAGTYTIELQVYDDDNAANCGTQAFVMINAVPGEDLHVQLVWDTPTDPNQTDANGTDLDLHFLHPMGTWNNAPWDIYWLNPTAEWGAAGPVDDPSLDIDDTNGAGPENINLDAPESGITYAIGAYYYADNGYGPSYATLRVFVQGMLEFEYRDMYLPTTGTFWNAATISWPSGTVTAVNNVQQGFPGTSP